MITGMSQYGGGIGSFNFIIEKKDIIFSYYYREGSKEREDWTTWFSKMKPNSTGFLLKFTY